MNTFVSVLFQTVDIIRYLMNKESESIKCMKYTHQLVCGRDFPVEVNFFISQSNTKIETLLYCVNRNICPSIEMISMETRLF